MSRNLFFHRIIARRSQSPSCKKNQLASPSAREGVLSCILHIYYMYTVPGTIHGIIQQDHYERKRVHKLERAAPRRTGVETHVGTKVCVPGTTAGGTAVAEHNVRRVPA